MLTDMTGYLEQLLLSYYLLRGIVFAFSERFVKSLLVEFSIRYTTKNYIVSYRVLVQK